MLWILINKKISFSSASALIIGVRKENRENSPSWQSTYITINIEKRKARGSFSFLAPLSVPDPLKPSSSPLHFIVVLKKNSKTQGTDKALTKKRRKKLCCYGSVYSELLKFGAYLYFKTNRDHVHNSRWCKGRTEFITGKSMWGQELQAFPVEEVGWAAAAWLERAHYCLALQAESTVWYPSLLAGYTCNFATLCTIFWLVLGVTSKTK